MPSTPAKKLPVNWDDYEHGRSPSQSSVGSWGRAMAARANRGDEDEDEEIGSMPRRGSFGQRILQAGGLNSIDGFARSWQRAAGFHELSTQRPSFLISEDGHLEGPRDEEHRGSEYRSLLRQNLEHEGRHYSESVLDETESLSATPRAGHGFPSQSIRKPPSQWSLGGSLRGYGSIPAASIGGEDRRVSEQVVAEALLAEGDREPILVKEVQLEDGTKAAVVVGQSTMPATISNSVNVMIGVGLLGLPIALRYTGWIVGLAALLATALATYYTAGLLKKCMDADITMRSYADIAYHAFGYRVWMVVIFLFTLELLTASVALLDLFADSMAALIPIMTVIQYKVLAGIVLIPLNFVPFHILGSTSTLGVLSCTMLILLIFVDGFAKTQAPGSLLDPAPTYLTPRNWLTVPLGLGLVIAPFGGHSIFPAIYRDMRHPYKYKKSLRVTFSVTSTLDLGVAVAGLLMFGDAVKDEVTSSILVTPGYPSATNTLIIVFIAVIAVTKLPLNCRPIIDDIENKLGLGPHVVPPIPTLQGRSALSRGLLKSAIRIGVVLVVVIIAILIPDFDTVTGFMGSALCFSICITLPCAFYLRILWDEISRREKALNFFAIIFCSCLSVVGTVWAFLPKDLIDP